LALEAFVFLAPFHVPKQKNRHAKWRFVPS